MVRSDREWPEGGSPKVGAVFSERLSREALAEIIEAMDDPSGPAEVDWQKLPLVDDTLGRLRYLARVKVVVSEDNPERQKQAHYRTVENHIKLALETAGSIENLAVFLDILTTRLKEPDPDRSLADQALQIWAPAAGIAGDYERKRALENAAFKVAEPEEYRKIKETYEQLLGDIESTKERIHDELWQILAAHPDIARRAKVELRLKTAHSVAQKQRARGEGYVASDYLAARIVIASGDESQARRDWPQALQDCYVVRDALLGYYELVEGRLKDYTLDPKRNEYSSIHLTVSDAADAVFEIQIRTSQMHERAEAHPGLAHIVREASRGTPTLGRIGRWRAEAARQIAQRRDGRLNGLRERHSEDEGPVRLILVFAEDGNLYELEEGSTMLDFAFAVHTKQAFKAQMFFRDGKPVGFDERVRFGDRLDIRYAKSTTYSPRWLGKVQSRHAKRVIGHYRRRKHDPDLMESGQRALAESVKQDGSLQDVPGWNSKAPILEQLTEQDRAAICRQYGLKDFDALLCGIGDGTYQPGRLIAEYKRRRGVT